jgi:hypothetical protein
MFAINLDIGNIILKYGWYINLDKKRGMSGETRDKLDNEIPLGTCPWRIQSRGKSEE